MFLLSISVSVIGLIFFKTGNCFSEFTVFSGYAWAVSDTRLSENKNTEIDFSKSGNRIGGTAGAPVLAVAADFGYRFDKYAGVFLSGAYILNNGVAGNFLFGGGIRIYAF